MISINEFISTTFLSGLLDDLLQLGQVRLRKLSVGGLQQRSHRLRDRPLKKSGNDSLQRGSTRVFPRHSRHVNVARAVAAMPDVSLFFQNPQQGPDGPVTRRIRQG